MRQIVFITLLLSGLSGSFANQPVAQPSVQTAPAKQGVTLKTVGANLKMTVNKLVGKIDSRPYTEVKLPGGEKVLWNQSSSTAYQVKGANGEVLYRGTSNSSPQMKQIKANGAGDLEGIARYQGKLTEARAKIDLNESYLKSLKMKQQAGMASAKDIQSMKAIEKSLPKYKKAYKSLHKQANMASGRSTALKAGFKGALTAAGIGAGISVLTDTLNHDGEVNLGRALSHMATPGFVMGLAGGTVGSMLMSAIPVPGIGGGLLKALPAFLGGAVGFEMGAGTINQVNWPRLIASTAASAAAFGLIGGPIGIGASILAGIVVDQIFEDPTAEDSEITDPFIPDWNALTTPGQGPRMGGFEGMQNQLPTDYMQNYVPNQVQAPPGQNLNLDTLKAKLMAIIKEQQDMITGTIQRTNVNLTDADKDNFRRSMARIDGLVNEANPLIAMMEQTQVNGANESLQRELRQMIAEVKNNSRQIQEYNGKMNLVGTGAAGPAAASSSMSVEQLQAEVNSSYQSYLAHIKAHRGEEASKAFQRYQELKAELENRRR